MKKRYIIGIILSIIFTYLAFRNVDLVIFFRVFKSIKYGYAVPIVFCTMGGFVFRAIRWKYFIKPVKVITISRLFSSVMIGFMANNILPVRLGEIVRAYSIGKMENISKSSAFATVVIERVLDVFFMLFLFLLLLFLFPLVNFPEELVKGTYYILILFLFVLIFLLFIMRKRDFVLNLIEKILSSFPEKISKSIQRVVDSFIKGLDFFHNTHHFIPIIFLTVLMWLLYMGSYYFAFMAFDFFNGSYHEFLLKGVVLLVLGSIGLMIPSAPGAIGTFHYFCILGLLIAGLNDKNQNASYAVFIHGINYISITSVGFIFFLKENMRLSEMGLKDEKSCEKND